MYMTYLVCVSVVQMGPAVFFFFFLVLFSQLLVKETKSLFIISGLGPFVYQDYDSSFRKTQNFFFFEQLVVQMRFIKCHDQEQGMVKSKCALHLQDKINYSRFKIKNCVKWKRERLPLKKGLDGGR